jgi:hypothetical protein
MKILILNLALILTFTNINAKKVLIWCTNKDQITELHKNPAKPYPIMGEAIVFWSLYEALIELGFEVINIRNENELTKNLNDDVHKIVVDLYTLEKTKTYLINEKFVDKIYSIDYWGCDNQTIEERKNAYQNGNYKLKLDQFLTPFDYNNQNQFLGFIIKQQVNKGLEKDNYGMYWGKFPHYINKDLMNLINSKSRRMKANLAYTNFKLAKYVQNHGLVDRTVYHNMLSKSLFLLGSGDPKAGPSILEALLYSCFVLAPAKQIPEQLHSNPGVILIDINNKNEIIKIIDDIFSKRKTFPKNSFPIEFSKEEHLKRVARLFS